MFAVPEQHERALAGEVHLLGRVDRALEVLGGVEEADVEVHAQPHLLGLGEQRLPVVVDEPGQADLVVAGREQHALVPELVGPLHLGDRLSTSQNGSIIIGTSRWVGRAPLDQPVVVGAHASVARAGAMFFRNTWLWKPRMFGYSTW